MSTVLAVIAISLEVLPTLCHRLITNPYPEHEWDSVIVSSDPITIRDKTHNASAPLPPQKRSLDPCAPNDFLCLYPDQQPPKDTARIVQQFLRQYSDPEHRPQPTPDQTSRNAHWTMLHSHTHNHPFDDNHGWVTLDPVPWSTSKIAKWHPNTLPAHHDDKPWDYAPTTHRPVHHFWLSTSTFHPDRPSTHWGVPTNDIITDNNPTPFPAPQFHNNPHPPDHHHHNHHTTNDLSPTRNPLPFPQPHLPIPAPHPNNIHQTHHPSTYPANGNGEWVLLSTTKGYSHPHPHKWPPQKDLNTIERLFASRKIKAADISKYHEEDLQDHLPPTTNRKSDVHPADNTTDDQPPLHVLYTASSKDPQPSTTVTRKLRLQVLPSLTTTSTSHGGLLEVASSSHSVDDAHHHEEEENLAKLSAIANVKKNKIRGYKLVPTSKITGKSDTHTNVMTLAAVGAGMIPATMALLVPMALGRRRRRSVGEGLAEGE